MFWRAVLSKSVRVDDPVDQSFVTPDGRTVIALRFAVPDMGRSVQLPGYFEPRADKIFLRLIEEEESRCWLQDWVISLVTWFP